MWKREDWADLFTLQPDPYPAWWQDPRHIAFQYQLAMACPQHFRRVLEIGCFEGASTSGYVQAMIDGAPLELTCCDIAITDKLRATVARAPRPVELLEMESLFALKPHFDVVILDGHHCVEIVSREIGLCLAYETPTVIMHDTHIGSRGFEGPAWGLGALQSTMLYACVSDHEKRKGEYTHRGLSVCTRALDVFRAARQLWGKA